MSRLDKPPINHEEAEEIIKELIQAVNQDPEILALIVFGSYARNELFHDIDICLVSNIIPTSVQIQKKYYLHFSEYLDISFFDKLPVDIQKEVCRDGDIRINKDYDKLFDIYIDCFHEFESFYPRLKMIISLD